MIRDVVASGPPSTRAANAAGVVVKASAPGKLILMGEHSVVYGYPAVAAAVQQRLTVSASPVNGHPLDSAPAAGEGEATVELVLAGAPPVVHAWRDVLQLAEEVAPSDAAAAARARYGAAYLALVSLGEAVRLLGRVPPSMTVRVHSEIPVGHGMGSSAALALAVIAAVVGAAGTEMQASVLEDAAQNVERRQHGSPSGIDVATVLRGGVVGARRGSRSGQGRALSFRPLVTDPGALSRFRAYDSGCPVHDTGEVVAAVRRRLEADGGLQQELVRMADATREFTGALVTDGDPAAVSAAIRRFEAGLEALGVVPPAMAGLIRRIERKGGAAKISGAGALCDGRDGRPGAGMLLVHHEEPDRIRQWSFLDGLPPVDAHLGGPGLEVW